MQPNKSQLNQDSLASSDHGEADILAFGYLSALPARFRWDIQVPRRFWRQWADTHEMLTGIRIAPSDVPRIAGLSIITDKGKRAPQNRFQYFPAGCPPKMLESKSKPSGSYKRVSDKAFSQRLRRFGKGPLKTGAMDWSAGYQSLTSLQKTLFDTGKAMASLPGKARISEQDFIKGFREAERKIAELISRPFRKTASETGKHLVATLRMARSAAFRQMVMDSYNGQCALCGHSFRFDHHVETEAAHIVPKAANGTDDPRNGIALCRSHHWAFDAGMWTVKPNGRVVVSKSALALPENAELKQYRGNRLKRGKFAPAQDALTYRFEKIFLA